MWSVILGSHLEIRDWWERVDWRFAWCLDWV